MSVRQHHESAPRSVACAILTVSDTRTLSEDKGGNLLVELVTASGHQIAARDLLPDEPEAISKRIRGWVADPGVDAVLVTGGTGISPRDQTFETVMGVLTKPLPGYGELFRMLSYEEIGPAAMLSRAVGGLCQRTVVLTMPGSTAAVRLAAEKLIVPELGHLVSEANK